MSTFRSWYNKKLSQIGCRESQCRFTQISPSLVANQSRPQFSPCPKQSLDL